MDQPDKLGSSPDLQTAYAVADKYQRWIGTLRVAQVMVIVGLVPFICALFAIQNGSYINFAVLIIVGACILAETAGFAVLIAARLFLAAPARPYGGIDGLLARRRLVRAITRYEVLRDSCARDSFALRKLCSAQIFLSNAQTACKRGKYALFDQYIGWATGCLDDISIQ